MQNAAGVNDFKYPYHRSTCARDAHPAAAADQHPQSEAVEVAQPGQITSLRVPPPSISRWMEFSAYIRELPRWRRPDISTTVTS